MAIKRFVVGSFDDNSFIKQKQNDLETFKKQVQQLKEAFMPVQ